MEQVGFKATESSPASVVRLKSLLRVNTKTRKAWLWPSQELTMELGNGGWKQL